MPYSDIQNNSIVVEEEEEEKKHRAGFYIGIIIAIVAIVLAILLAVYMFLGSTQRRGGELGQLDGKTAEEIQAELNRIVEEGMMNISIASVVEFENGSSEGELKIENSPANHYLQRVEIQLNDSGEVIYTSDILEPNYHVQSARLDRTLPAGTYPCTAVFYALNPDTEEVEGQAAAQMTIVVQS